MDFDIVHSAKIHDKTWRKTVGWKARVEDNCYGAYIEYDDEPTEEQLRMFASSILFFIDYPDNYLLTDGVTPLPLGGK